MDESNQFRISRLVHLAVLFTAFFVLLGVRLYRLQVVQAETYLRQSETNRVRVLETPPLRGLMFDREGRLIVDNYPSYTLFATPYVIDQNPTTRHSLLILTGIGREEFEHRLRRIKNNLYTPVRILRDVPFSMYAAIEERKVHLPGISFQIEPKRAYLQHVASHSLGHIGELKEENVRQYPGQESGDIVGLSGLEKTWNKELRGERGYKYIEVDVVGRVIGSLQGADPIPPKPGKDLILTIDLELQLLAEELLEDHAGAIVCIEPATGEILAIASKPDYPPETFANVLTPGQWRQLQDDPAKPLLHRAIQGAYPPGSIFKMSVLAAGLECGEIDRSWTITCKGGTQLGKRWFNCWKKTGHGKVDHKRSIEASCDVFYYQLGLKLGIDRFHEYIGRFCFGRRTGVDLVHESEGLLPSQEYLDKRYGKNKWTEGVLYNIAIGQGEVLVTPIQAANFAATLANGGWWLTPHLVKGHRHLEDEIVPVEKAESYQTGFSADVMKTVRDNMLLVTEGKYGTAAWLYDPRIHVAGKTGTAQNPHGEDHALFIAFAPFDDPRIAVAVVVEHGEHGSTTAAPITYKLIRKYLDLDEDTWRRYRAKVLTEIANQRIRDEAAEAEVQE